VRPPAVPAVTPASTPAAAPRPPPPPPAPGETVGDRFRVVRLLGEGDFGRVYLGEALSTGTVYALKTPRDEVLRDSRARELFRREAQRWVDLERHPWLVRAFFAGEIQGRLYLATEYVASGEDEPNSLEGFLRTSPPDLAQSLRWGVQVCHAMEHALARGVRCHRDIKPANVLIGPDRAVRICDLGIAGLPPAKAGAGDGFGTPTHMSPEQFADAAGCDERSDVYSFGVVLFQMASKGRLPFPPPALPDGPDRAARAWLELQRLHREAPVPPLDSPLAPIVARCLEKSPARRYRGFAELRGDLEALLLHQTDEVLRLPTRTETEGWDLTSKGLGLMSLGRPQEALACYEGAIARNPLAAAIHASRGRALEALGRFEEASRAFERAADLDPQYARAPSRPARRPRRVAEAPGTDRPAAPPVPDALLGGRYEVGRVLGEGAFGVVTLAYDHEAKVGCALKTLRDDYWADRQARATFEKEAGVWAGLERHPYLVRAHAVEEIGGSIYLAMDYVAPEEPGLGSLEGHLARRPPSLARSLRWGIQLCHGMEHANARGIRCHRNVKPSNILVGQDGAVRVSDFGLAGARLGPGRGPGSVLPADPSRADTVFGTPTHMPPEQFTSAAACDVRSDVYAFGVVLYQMASGGSLPFLALVELGRPQERAARFWQEMGRLHADAPPPPLESPLFPVIRRCLEKDPARRFPGFAELRGELAALLKREANEEVTPPPRDELQAWEWIDKGLSLSALERFDEAARGFERAIAIQGGNAVAWNGKGSALQRLGRRDEALASFEEALVRNPRYPAAWRNKGVCLSDLGRPDEAFKCLDQGVALDPDSAAGWNDKAACLKKEGRYREALGCLQEAIALDPGRDVTWIRRAECLEALGDRDGARAAREKAAALVLPGSTPPVDARVGAAPPEPARAEAAAAGAAPARANPAPLAAAPAPLEVAQAPLAAIPAPVESEPHPVAADPLPVTAETAPEDDLVARGIEARGIEALEAERAEDALACFDRALEAEPDRASAWALRASSLNALGRWTDAAASADRALAKDPRRAAAWLDKGLAKSRLGRYLEALQCYEQAVALEPAQDVAWRLKGDAFSALGQEADAVDCYARALEANPRAAGAWCDKAAALDRLNRHEEAVAAYDAALALDPRQARPWFDRGTCLHGLGRVAEAAASFEKALAACDQALVLGPGDLRTLQGRAEILGGLGRYEDAIACCDEALALAPSHAPTLHARGLALFALGRPEDALLAFDQALESDPGLALARFNKASAEDRLGRTVDAARSFREFLAMAPPGLANRIQHARSRLSALQAG